MKRSCLICPLLFAILSVPAFILLYTFTGIIVLLLLVLASLQMRTAVKIVVRFWARASFVLILKRLRVVGKEHIEKDKKYILIANHASLFDILAIVAFYPNISFFGKEYLTKIPVFGKVIKMIDFIPMKTTTLSNTRDMLTQLSEKAESVTIAIFPEGTRTRDGQLNRFRKGFIHLLRATDHQILPVTLKGFYFFKPPQRFYINFVTRLKVIIHPPINNEELRAKDDQEIIETVKGIIESAYY
ncbi:MAG: 1-acyl-sn-glycerol-3-phosphate acyltransferase [Bacteroidales bacterium]|nr:1-acyl-sn-glycerol-3-phosphate acyltransferase [Bacteroidales bacterium]